MIFTAFSNRYYENEMENFAAAVDELARLNDCKIKAYNAAYNHKYFHGKKNDILTAKGLSLDKYLQSLGMSSVYSNALAPFIQGIIASQDTNHQNYIVDLQDEIKSMQEKVKDLEDQLAKKASVKKSIVNYAKTGKWSKPYKDCSIVIKNDILNGFKIPEQDYRVYERKVESDIRHLKSQIGNVRAGIANRKVKLKNMTTKPPKRAVFGSKKLYRQKDTVGNTAEWHEEFTFARHRSITLSGRADSKNGNFIIKWNEKTKDLVWPLRNGKVVVFPNYLPRNYEDDFIKNLSNSNASHTTVSYTIELHKGSDGRRYFIVKCTVKVEREDINDSVVDGIIGVDINYDRLAWSNIGAKGELIEHGVIPMKLFGLSSKEAQDVIGRSVKQLTQICVQAHKPLAREDLDAQAMRRDMKYKSPLRNLRVSQFACEKIIQTIEAQAYKNGFSVFKTDPKYTSLISKTVHMRKYGLSVHEGASYEIGLRTLGLETKFPEILKCYIPKAFPYYAIGRDDKQYYECWRNVYGHVKNIRAHTFFLEIPTFDMSKDADKWFKEHNNICKAQRLCS